MANKPRTPNLPPNPSWNSVLPKTLGQKVVAVASPPAYFGTTLLATLIDKANHWNAKRKAVSEIIEKSEKDEGTGTNG